MVDFREFVDDYYRRFVEVLETFDRAPMSDVLATLERVRDSGGTIWVAGNGSMIIFSITRQRIVNTCIP